MIEPLPPALAALIAAERTAPVATPAVRGAIKAKLAASIAAAPVGAAALGFGAGKILAILALTVGAGTATVAAVKVRGHAEAGRAPTQIAALARPAPEPPAPAVHDVPPAPLVAQVPTPVTPPAVHPQPVVASQPELLREAWTALAQRDSRRALELVELDVRMHPAGALDEERRALEIVALAHLGDLDRATRSAEAFSVRYPHSIHHSLIAKTLGGVP